LWILSPILPRLSGEFAYSLWQYRIPKTLHIFNPALTYESEHIRIDLRWWSTYVVLPPPEEDFATATTGWVHAVSLRISWNPLRETMLGASYTYGPELDRNPFSYQLLGSSSHTIAVFADQLVQPGFGLAPSLSLERRRPQDALAISIFSAELAAYLRW
jgi:hypothetical protein